MAMRNDKHDRSLKATFGPPAKGESVRAWRRRVEKERYSQATGFKPSATPNTLATNPAQRGEPNAPSLGSPGLGRGRAKFIPKRDDKN